MTPEEGKRYVTRHGQTTTPLKRIAPGSRLSWTAKVAGADCWWLENGQYADGGHAFDLLHEVGQEPLLPEPPVQRAAVIHQPDFIEMVYAKTREPLPKVGPTHVPVKPKTYLDAASEVLGEMVEMCDEALEFDPVSDLASSSDLPDTQ